MMGQIYLDNNATTRIDPRVAAAMFECYEAGFVNPASQHRSGQRARRTVEDARDRIGELLGCRHSGTKSDRIIFTSGGTESNNLAIGGLASSCPGQTLISAIEHPSVTSSAEHLQVTRHEVHRLRVSPVGIVDLQHLDDLLQRQTRLVSVMLGNNETGALQPIAEIAARCRARGVAFHTDAVQAVGKIPVDFSELAATALSLTVHKFHGPRGIGALLVEHGAELTPQLHGGFQQMGLRPGTEDVALVVGLLKALEIFVQDSDQRTQYLLHLRDRFEHKLRAKIPGIVISAENVSRLPHTSNVAFPGVDRQAFVIALDLADVACSTGSACASGSSEPSSVLLAMGVDSQILDSSVRFSFGADNTIPEIDEAVERISRVFNNLQR